MVLLASTIGSTTKQSINSIEINVHPKISKHHQQKTKPKPLSSLKWKSIQNTIKNDSFSISYNHQTSNYTAENKDQDLSLRFHQGSVEITSKVSNCSSIHLIPKYLKNQYLQMSFPDNPNALITENRIDYIYSSNLIGWYENTNNGLEQGFTLITPPFKWQLGPLSIEIEIQTNFTPNVSPDGSSIFFKNDNEDIIMTYGDLIVIDADEKILPSYISYENDRGYLIITIDDRNATYPITIDPLVSNYITKLVASDGDEFDNFGYSVDINNNTIIVGAYADDVNGNDYQGSAYVFYQNNSNTDDWIQVKKLIASDGEFDDDFGYSVSIYEDTIIIGAYEDHIGGNVDQGSVYIFERDYGGIDNWGEVIRINASDGAADDNFGYSVSIDNDTIVVGAPYDDIGGNTDQGSAYVFYRDQGGADNWGQVKKIIASDGFDGDQFGTSVSISGDHILIGALNDNVGTNNYQGSAYLFDKNNGGADNWGEVKKITASDGESGDHFGNSVSIHDDFAVIGSYHDWVNGTEDQGSAYLYSCNQGGVDNWGEVTKLVSSDGNTSDYFGCAVSIWNDTIVIGSYNHDVNGTENQGAAYVFAQNQSGIDDWVEQTSLTAVDGQANDWYGYSLAIENNTIIIGSYLCDINNISDQGACYLYNLNSSLQRPDPPSLFTVSTENSSVINVTWVKGSRADYTKIQRRNDSYPVNNSDGIQVYNGTGTSFTDSNLISNTTYYYRAWGYNTSSNQYSTSNASGYNTTENDTITGLLPPSNFSATASGSSTLLLSWTKAGDADITFIRYQKGSTAPINRSDGTLGYNGSANSTSISGLKAGTTYGFTAWSYNVTTGQYSLDNITCTGTTTSSGSSQGTTSSSNHRPLADAGGPYAGVVGEPIMFNATASSDPDTKNDQLDYSWDFEDNQTGTGITVSHSYEEPGEYTITLVVSDGKLSDTDITSAIISIASVDQLTPVAVINGPSLGVVNITIQFNGSLSYDPDGSIVSYQWDFGDGDKGNGPVTTHQFKTNDTFHVNLTVIDNDGYSNSTAMTITIYRAFKIVDEHIIIDTDQDGLPDLYYNLKTHDHTEINQTSNETFLIDVNNDGIIDLIYDITDDELRPYHPPDGNDDSNNFSWMFIPLIGGILLSCMVIYLYRRQKGKENISWLKLRK